MIIYEDFYVKEKKWAK